MPSTALAAAPGVPSDRRKFLSHIGLATLAAATAAVPADAEHLAQGVVTDKTPGPIEIAYFEYVRLSKIADDAVEATCKIEEKYEEPERPRWHAFSSQGAYKLVVTDHTNRKCRLYLDDRDENILELQSIIASADPGHELDNHPLRVERARKTLAAIVDWKSECQRRSDEVGLTAARELEAPLLEAMNRQYDAILELRAASFREAAFQAAALQFEWDERAADHLIQRLSELAGIPSYFDEEGTRA